MSDTTNNTTKMLQAILNGQSATNQRIDKLDKKVDALRIELKTDIKEVEKELTSAEKRLTKRIDKLGKSLAYLEDDVPTKEEHDELEKGVEKLEQKATFALINKSSIKKNELTPI
ncbi:hypothetical protein HYS95_01855 [Candidatus Daviesbacteria bacterium]|nr:hypothetical protein [Candidatus Daviesbacteria bacterium]